jgi:hypothetical protein
MGGSIPKILGSGIVSGRKVLVWFGFLDMPFSRV